MLGWWGERGRAHVCAGTHVQVRAPGRRVPGRHCKQARVFLGDAAGLALPHPHLLPAQSVCEHARELRASARGERGIARSRGRSPRGLPAAPPLCLEDASTRLLGNKPIYKAIRVTSVGTYASCWDTGSVNERHWWQLAERNPPGVLQLGSVVAPELGGKP